MGEDEEKPKDIIRFTAEKLSVEEVSQLVTSPLCGAVSLFVGECVSPAPLPARGRKGTGVPSPVLVPDVKTLSHGDRVGVEVSSFCLVLIIK